MARGLPPGERGMPMHNWTRVPPPVFHGFHIAWVGALTGALNNGVLPPSCHAAAWAEVTENAFTLPAGKPLTLVAYCPGSVTTAYVETLGAGDALPDMPLFLGPEAYVSVPLEATYQEAYRTTPEYWRHRLE